MGYLTAATAAIRYVLPSRISRTPRLIGVQPRGMFSVPGGRWYPKAIVNAQVPRRRPRWQVIAAMTAAVAAVAMWVLVQGHAVVRSESSASHPAHVSVSSHSTDSSVHSDDAHLGHPSPGGHHEALVTAVLPHSPAPTVAALTVLVVAVAVAFFWRQATFSGRGPPRRLAAAVTGQDLLTRFCLSRR